MSERQPPDGGEEITYNEAPFKTEMQTFESLLPSLLETNPGEWALIKETDLGGIYPDRGEAINAGYEKYGNDIFLTIQILEKQPQYFWGYSQAA